MYNEKMFGTNEPVTPRVIAFDIETIPNENMVSLLPEPELKLGNIKDASKIEEKRVEAKEKQIEKMGVYPETGMVCSYAVYGYDEYGKEIKESYVINEVSYSEEIILLNNLFKTINSALDYIGRSLVVTFNGIEFDLPYIYKRAMINSIELPARLPPLSFWTRKYQYEPHLDLLQVWRNWSSHSQSSSNLDYLGCLLLGAGKTERNYSEYLGLIKNGEGNKIAIDNLCDVKITYELYRKFKGYLYF